MPVILSAFLVQGCNEIAKNINQKTNSATSDRISNVSIQKFDNYSAILIFEHISNITNMICKEVYLGRSLVYCGRNAVSIQKYLLAIKCLVYTVTLITYVLSNNSCLLAPLKDVLLHLIVLYDSLQIMVKLVFYTSEFLIPQILDLYFKDFVIKYFG